MIIDWRFHFHALSPPHPTSQTFYTILTWLTVPPPFVLDILHLMDSYIMYPNFFGEYINTNIYIYKHLEL